LVNGQTRTHKIHHDSDLRETTTFPLIVFSVPNHGTSTQMSFCPKTPKFKVLKFSKLGFSQLWRPITSCANLQLRWGLKQCCSPCWEISNGMWHATWTQIICGDSWLLVVGSQIDYLTPGPSFGHNLCLKYPNG
jgi:hypothetical protein